jgi:6-phosphogluconolactonase
LTNGVELVLVETADDVAREVADRLAHAAGAGGHIALTGGTTPGQAYQLAAQHQGDWSNVELWWSDERCVPPDDERSNYGLSKRTLIDNLSIAPRAVHRIKGELGKDVAAAGYERELGNTEFDLELLGVGPDGHVASLFPNAPTLQEQTRRVVPAEPGLEPFVDRVSLSLPALRSARQIVFALAGAGKADAARRAFASEPGPQTPASLVRAVNGTTVAILDRAAAAELPA